MSTLREIEEDLLDVTGDLLAWEPKFKEDQNYDREQILDADLEGDLGADSLDIIEISMEMENKLLIEFPYEMVEFNGDETPTLREIARRMYAELSQ